MKDKGRESVKDKGERKGESDKKVEIVRKKVKEMKIKEGFE